MGMIGFLMALFLCSLLSGARPATNYGLGLGRNLMKKKDAKEGAGMLMFGNGTALVVLRGFKGNNPRTWTVPGGNVKPDDDDLFKTAEREVKEELGRLPANFTRVDEIVTERGSDDKKYTVFLLEVPVEVIADYYPVLNKEHTHFKWFPYAELFNIFNKHPVLDKLLEKHRPEVELAFGLVPATKKKEKSSEKKARG